MATILSASIYGLNGNQFGTAQGVTMGFPTANILIRPAPVTGSTFGTVTALSIIQLLPMGTKVAQDQYFAIAAPSALITAANT